MRKFTTLFTVLTLILGLTACGKPANTSSINPQTVQTTEGNSDSSDVLNIAEQGIFSVGGIVKTSEGVFNPEDQWEESGKGQTSHVDHANVFFQRPENETGLPMVFLHGYGQSRISWMTTPDGRDGWSDIFLKKGHSVYLIDEPSISSFN